MHVIETKERSMKIGSRYVLQKEFKERSEKKGSRYVPQKPIQGTIHKEVQGTTHINGLD
jgi:hypothetical protein